MIKMTEENMKNIIDSLKELQEDNTVPKNVKSKIEEVIKTLKEESEVSMRVNKALNVLDELSDDTNMQAYTRTQIWNIVSALEMI